MNKFIYDPPNGLLDKNAFPSNPQTEDSARGQFMELFNQIKTYVNETAVKEIEGRVKSSDLTSANETNGNLKLPGGLILQWGLVNITVAPNGYGTVEVTPGIKVPNKVVSQGATCAYNATTANDSHIDKINCVISVVNNSSLYRVVARDVGGLSGSQIFEVRWWTLGY